MREPRYQVVRNHNISPDHPAASVAEVGVLDSGTMKFYPFGSVASAADARDLAQKGEINLDNFYPVPYGQLSQVDC